MSMEAATVAPRLQISTWMVDSDKVARRRPKSTSAAFSRRLRDQNTTQVLVAAAAAHLPTSQVSNRKRRVALEVSCSYNNFPSMMGSGKTTVGKIMAQALSYSFIDSDSLVEHDVGGTSVAEIFKLYGEDFFRDKETEALRKLSLMHRLVVSTGGGAVVRPVNWKCMKKGISVWLDVPLEALAKRIAAVGTGSRPLLHHGSGDAYRKTYMRLTSLFEERGDSYANANARVSLENIAAKLGCRDVSNLTPTAIVIEALEQIEGYLKEEHRHAHITF